MKWKWKQILNGWREICCSRKKIDSCNLARDKSNNTIWFARCSHLISKLVGCAWWTGVSSHCDSDAKYEEYTSWFLSQCSLITFYFWGKFHWWCSWRFSSFLPPHFWPMLSFHTSWKHQKIKGTNQKTKGILVFSGSMKWENYPEMG